MGGQRERLPLAVVLVASGENEPFTTTEAQVAALAAAALAMGLQTDVIRAVAGVAEPIYHHGEIVGYRQRHSDICLLALLSAYRPERFKHRHQHSEKDGRPRGVHVSYEKMKPDDVT